MTTIKDVARLANVATSSVSRVLNNEDFGSRRIRERVLAACKQLNYIPDSMARSMVVKNTKLIGIIIPDASNSFYASIIKGAYDILNEAGYDMIICNTYEQLDKEEESMRTMLQRKVDGVIISSPQQSMDMFSRSENHIPIVVTDMSIDASSPYSTVLVDQEDAGYTAGKYLIEQGHRKFGVIASGAMKYSTEIRMKGIAKACRESGTALREDWVCRPDFSVQETSAATLGLLSAPELPTALIALSNTATLGALLALKELQLTPGRDISIIGFGDERWYQLLEPQITVMAHPTKLIGTTSAVILLQQLNGEKEREMVVMKSRLIERGSVKLIE